MRSAKYLDIFIEEAQENLQSLDRSLLRLEKGGYDAEVIKRAYRVVHTLKGNAGILGLTPINELAHHLEDLFDTIKEKGCTPRKEVLDLMFRGSDLIERMIGELVEHGEVRSRADTTVAKLRALKRDEDAIAGERSGDRSVDASAAADSERGVDNGAAAVSNGPDEDEGAPTGAASLAKEDAGSEAILKPQFRLSDDQRQQAMEAIAEGYQTYLMSATFEPDLRFREGRAFQLLRALSSLGYVIGSYPDTKDIDDDVDEIQLLLATKEPKPTLIETASDITGIADKRVGSYRCTTEAEAEEPSAADRAGDDEMAVGSDLRTVLSKVDTVRVKSRLLDQLLDLVGELMISNIRINQLTADIKDRDLNQVLKTSERLMGELQDTVLRMRMVPVDYIFQRFPRMMRDLSKERNKAVDFEIVGNDIEIDRSLLDNIGDSLVHLLRNAVDHGIEPESERIAKGKQPEGWIRLSAYREQSNIMITVEDDGRGIDLGELRARAVKEGVVTDENVDGLDQKDMISLAFLPSVSTAEEVTAISGRGVGLDVVKTKIESLGGTVKLETEPGRGTKITLRLPPSMAIIRAMLVNINDEKYAIPLENVKETVKVPLSSIHEIAENGFFRLRDEVLPLVNVHRDFGSEDEFQDDMPGVIVEKAETRACLIVSGLIGQQEIVVKNLSQNLRATGCFSGATILGDGKVAMILDVGAFL